MANKTRTVAQTIIEVLINHIHNIDIAKTFSILCLDECLYTGNASTGSSSSSDAVYSIYHLLLMLEDGVCQHPVAICLDMVPFILISLRKVSHHKTLSLKTLVKS